MLGPTRESLFPLLRDIRGIDCVTSKCLANAFCTGRVTWDPGGTFWIEVECPDCAALGPEWTPATQRLGDALLGASPESQEILIRDFVATRPRGPHPLRDP